MKKLVPLVFIGTLLLSACHDVSKQRQLKETNSLLTQLDSMQYTWNQAQIDSVPYFLKNVTQVMNRIKRRNNLNEPITVEFAQKLEDYKYVEAGFNYFLQTKSDLESSIKISKFSIRNLANDIEQGIGDRAKYDSFLANEKATVTKLDKFMHQNLEIQSKCVNSYRILHTPMKNFSKH